MPKPSRTRKARAPPRARRPKAKPKPKRTPRSTAPRAFNAVRLGQRVGSIFGRPFGRIGAEAGRLFRNVTGFGDYKVSKNSLIGADSLPMFTNTSAGTRVTHREYLFDVITSPVVGQFTIQPVPIQPALLGSFPWLSASAENYQEYRLNGCIFEFKSNSYNALASTNTASGTVIMTTNYNVLDPVFTSKFTMEQSQFTCSDKPSNHLLHPIECNKLETPSAILYTRSGQAQSGDLRLYDWGNFNIATVGMQGSSTNIGELWVSYDVTLLKPKLGATSDVADHWVTLGPAIGSTNSGGPGYFGQLGGDLSMVLTTDSDMGTTLVASDLSHLDTVVWPPGYTGSVAMILRYANLSTPSASLNTPYNFVVTGSLKGLPLFAWGDPAGKSAENETVNGTSITPLVYNGNGFSTLVVFLSISNGGSIRLTGGTNGSIRNADLLLIAVPVSMGTGTLPLDPELSIGLPLALESKRSLVVDDEVDTESIHSYSRVYTPSHPINIPKSSSNKSTRSIFQLP